jgi:hypothetical protein
MRKWIIIFSAVLFLFGGQESMAQKPDYEKFGRIATAVVKEDYTGDKLQDYKYEGRKTLSAGKVQDSFTFDVVKDGKEVNVQVVVVHNPEKPNELSISVDEVE